MALDLDSIRERLAADPGKPYWRGLEELTDTPEFREMLQREFPDQAAEWTDPVTRRQFLVLMGASLALAGVAGCSTRPAPAEKIMPYVRQPEELVLGKPLFFATAMTLNGLALGLLVESHEGRPTKVEGNPSHPASQGATDVFAQASVLSLYDPDRSQTITYRGRPRSWSEALSALRGTLETMRASDEAQRGAGLRLLTETITSPTLAGQLQALLRDFPKAKWYQYDPAGRDGAIEGAYNAFGRHVNTHYDFQKAEVVLSLDADFLGCGPGHVRYVRDFMNRRRVRTGTNPLALAQASMNQLYVVDCTVTSTGMVADQRLPVRASQMENLVRALAVRLKVPQAPPAPTLPSGQQAFLEQVAADLDRNRGASIVIAGDGQPAVVHTLVHAINDTLGNTRPGKTVIHTAPVEARPAEQSREELTQTAQLRTLCNEMRAKQVEVLLILGGNPVFTAPGDLEFEKLLANVPLRVHLGLYEDETAALCDWHIPEAHFLEAWSDARAHDGTATIMQPLIAPLYNGRSAHELLAALTERYERQGYDIVRDSWRTRSSGDFERFWQKAVQEGVVPDVHHEFGARPATLQDGWQNLLPPARTPAGGPTYDIVFRPDPTIFDGRFANNGWLQELPKPVTRITWDNAAFLSPRTAQELGISHSYAFATESGKPGSHGGEHGQAIVDMIELNYRGGKVQLPVWITPGHPDDSITVHFGYGRQRAGRVGNGAGFNLYPLRSASAPWFDTGLEHPQGTGQRYTLACTQMHYTMQGREPVKIATLEEFKADRLFAKKLTTAEHLSLEVLEQVPGPVKNLPQDEAPDRRLKPLTLYPQGEYNYEPPNYKWGMVIDLSACVGCSACVIACQAENNSPVVGKDQVTRGREMHWLRVDRYYVGKELENPSAYFQPVPCMQCENAPCELVCPVGATVHSSDGLNDMVYNRCVGTRYCSNNCPYKVRRFNFLEYSDYATASLKLGRNPDVTVRTRGVMEKCTYCVQRIRNADIEAQKRTVDGLAAIEKKKLAGQIDPQEADRQAAVVREANRIHDGEVVTACQAACPAQAIIFGDLNDRSSTVYQWHTEPHNYALLAELNTRPRTTYLAAVRNPPHPENKP